MRLVIRVSMFLFILWAMMVSTILIPASSQTNSKYETLLSQLRQSIIFQNKEDTLTAISKLKELKTEMPMHLLLTDIKDASKEESYRGLMSDLLIYKMRYIKKDSFINSVPDFVDIIKNKNETAVIRRNIISAVTKGVILNDLADEKEVSTINIRILFRNIVNDKNENPSVSAQAIDALSRLKDGEIGEKLLDIIDNWTTEDPFKVKSASESLGRQKDKRAIPILINMVNLTDNIDIFVTAVYSLGMMESPELLEPILKNYDRFGLLGRSGCRGALKRNRELLIAIISKEKSGPMIPSIIALGKIKDKSALPRLKVLLNENSIDEDIILDTIHKIETE